MQMRVIYCTLDGAVHYSDRCIVVGSSGICIGSASLLSQGVFQEYFISMLYKFPATAFSPLKFQGICHLFQFQIFFSADKYLTMVWEGIKCF